MNILSNDYQTFQRATWGKVNIALNNSLLISREVLQTFNLKFQSDNWSLE